MRPFDQAVPTRELRGGTCAILGLGGVGRAVASLVSSLGMRVLALNSSGTTTAPVEFISARSTTSSMCCASPTSS